MRTLIPSHELSAAQPTIPGGWERVSLGEVCRRTGGSVQTGPFGSQLHAEDYKEEGTPIITVEHLGEGRIHHRNLPLVGAEDTQRLAKYSLRTGDLVFSRVGAIDRCAMVTEAEDGWLFSGRCLRVRASGEGVVSRYLSATLNHHDARQWIKNHSVGSTMACLNTKILSGVPILLPPGVEQARIAEVLDTLDEAIQGTQVAIHKLDTARQGALRDLLTCGVDKAGRARPKEDCSLFVNTPLGRLPRSWSVAKLGSLLTTERDPAMRSGPFGSELLKKDLVDEGIPLIGIDNVEVERFVPDFTRFITPWKFTDLSRYRSFPDDVLITIMGTVGRCCLVPEDIGDALTTKHVWAMSLDKDRYSPYLTCLQINHAPWALRHLNQDQQGGIMSAIRAETLRSILLPVPPREELEAIEAMLRSMGETIADEQHRLKKLRVLKSGLTSDLLTGRIRVPVGASTC